jgi:SAM-dependent methyltransferase
VAAPSPASNSFNLAPRSDVPRARSEACPLAVRPERIGELTGEMTDARFAFLRFKDRMRLFFANTRDFTDDEVARAKASGQLYMDVSQKVSPDDFSADLRKLELEAECGACPELAHCPGCFRAVAVDVFSRDETRVKTLLGRLEGAVLDVGAGHAPYAAAVARAVESGRASYLALDPDAARLELLKSRFPWARVRAGTLDDLVADPGRFDHALVLRSYNHFPDRDQALARLFELVKPGGRILVVDDVAFGLLRSREQTARAEGGPAVFEHYANETAADAAERVIRAGFEVLERHDVRADGSNEWIVEGRRPAG